MHGTASTARGGGLLAPEGAKVDAKADVALPRLRQGVHRLVAPDRLQPRQQQRQGDCSERPCFAGASWQCLL